VLKSAGNSTRISCQLAGLCKSSYYYQPKEDPVNTQINERLIELAQERPRFGSPRLGILLQQEFGSINHKRVERLYKQAGLSLPRKRKKRRWLGRRQPLVKPVVPFERWSMDLMMDSTAEGRRFRILTIVDDFTREAITCLPERSISSHVVIREMERVAEFHGKYPLSIMVDNGPEFTSRAFLSWAQYRQIDLLFIQPGKPTQNAYIESFNGKFRDECLNMNWFSNLDQAREIIENWQDDYNYNRPHSSLNYLTPNQFKQQVKLSNQLVQ
jgi:putative transposase